ERQAHPGHIGKLFKNMGQAEVFAERRPNRTSRPRRETGRRPDSDWSPRKPLYTPAYGALPFTPVFSALPRAGFLVDDFPGDASLCHLGGSGSNGGRSRKEHRLVQVVTAARRNRGCLARQP